MENLPKIIITSDGSPTLYLESLNETYHSRHGALQESRHVFIKMGLSAYYTSQKSIKILEIGLGTGLNAWLACDFSEKNGVKIDYTGIEAFPLPGQLNKSVEEGYAKMKNTPDVSVLHEILSSTWNEKVKISKTFSIEKVDSKIQKLELKPNEYDIVFFDAFGPGAQSEMWESQVLNPIAKAIKKGGILVSYSVQGQFRRILKSADMTVEKVEGPPGKRSMTRAWKK